MNKKIFLLLIFTVVILSGCKSVPGADEKIDINGMIYDTGNRPVANYRIYIDGKGECTSDIGGRFVISGIKKGEHVFSGFCEGYLGIEKKITVYDRSQILYIRVPSVESCFSQAFDFIKKGRLEEAEHLIREVLESDGENEDALYFMKTINSLRRENAKTEE